MTDNFTPIQNKLEAGSYTITCNDYSFWLVRAGKGWDIHGLDDRSDWQVKNHIFIPTRYASSCWILDNFGIAWAKNLYDARVVISAMVRCHVQPPISAEILSAFLNILRVSD